MSSFELSADYVPNEGKLRLTVRRSEFSSLYANSIPYEWTVLTGSWRTWDPAVSDWRVWDPGSAVWTREEGQGWIEPALSMTIDFPVPPRIRNRLLAFRLLPDDGAAPVWVYTGGKIRLYYWTVSRRKETLLYLQTDGAEADAQPLSLRRKDDPFLYPLPFQRIFGNAPRVCSLDRDFGEPTLTADPADPGSLALQLLRERYHK